MSENLKRFFKFVSKDEVLQEKMKALSADRENAVAYIIALAKEIDIELSEADFTQPDGEISEEELETISGGYTITEHEDCGCPISGSGTTVSNFCYCVAGGGGGGRQSDEDIWGCACVAYGQGGDAKDDHTTCMCVLYGHGEA